MSLPRDPQSPPELPLHISIQQRNFNSDRQKVPGSSPAYYKGDPRNNILVIEDLDLIPNPPIDHFTIRLVGDIMSDIGSDPSIKWNMSLDGLKLSPGSEMALPLRSTPSIELQIQQNGREMCPPGKGRVDMSLNLRLPTPWMKRGHYTVRTEMCATDGRRMTDFEGTIWIDGYEGEEPQCVIC